MTDIYQSFLRSPTIASLAPNASLHYITTTTSFHEPEAIVKHLLAHTKQVEKRSENVLGTMESSNGVCLETETTFKFVRSGGVILPLMDDNLLADMEAVCPMIHIVQFDSNRKITQIRLYWDQGTILKQVEAIGRTGRNWPIRAGQEQAKLIAQSAKASCQSQSQSASGASQSSNSAPTSNEQSQSGKSANDFHTRLFATGGEEHRSAPNDPKFAPRESAKPQERQFHELWAGESQDINRDPSPGVRSPEQPILKSGAGRNFQENRLFDDAASDNRGRSPDGKRVDPSKFKHFEFGNGEDAPDNRSASRNNSNQVSKLSFENFNTPDKVAPRPNFEQERHFGYGIDEDDPPSPPKRNIVHAPRPDADPHFRIADQNTPVAAEKRPLSNATNTHTAADRRREDMDSHSNIGQYTDPKKPGGHQARSDQTSSWSFQDMAEAAPSPTQKIYKTQGDGMGGKANSRFWEIGQDDEPEQYGGRGGTKQVYKTAGNGMGGRKGHGLSWSIGQDEDDS